MKSVFYSITDDDNVINKNLGTGTDFEIKFKDLNNVNSPVIVLNNKEFILYNYVYIEHFNRFYFITDIKVYPNNIYQLQLKCDLLMSFKDDILNCHATVIRQNNGNQYLSNDYETETRKECDIYKSNVTLDNNSSMILITTGV